jgi:hypothetical protein
VGQPLVTAPRSPSKKHSILWSLVHRKEAASQQSAGQAPQQPGASGASARSSAAAAATNSQQSSSSGAAPTAAAAPPSSLLAAASRQGFAQLPEVLGSGSAMQGDSMLQGLPAATDTEPCSAVAHAAGVPLSSLGPAAASVEPQLSALEPSSSAADVMAASMQRIASCLEDYLCDRSPATSPTRPRLPPAPQFSPVHAATAQQADATAASVGEMQVAGSPGRQGGRDQGQGSSGTAGDTMQQLTASGTLGEPTQQVASEAGGDTLQQATRSAGAGAAWGPPANAPGAAAPAVKPAWSPAVTAAKARMMAARSPAKLQQDTAVSAQQAGGLDTAQGLRPDTRDQDSNRHQGAPGGWVHPSELGAAAASAAAASGLANTALQQQWTVPPMALAAQLPRGLKPPPGVVPGPEQTSQAQAGAADQPVDKQPGNSGSACDSGAGGSDQLASLFALACRAVGVDVLQDTKDAAAPAVAAAALAVAMAAASSHGHHQTQPHQQQQRQSPALRHAVPSAGVFAPLSRHSPARRQQQQQQPGADSPRAMLWRPWGGDGVPAVPAGAVASAGCSSQTWIPAAAVATACAQSQGQVWIQSDQPSAASPGKGSRLWRQQPARSRVQQQQQCQGTTCLPDIRLLHPERCMPLLFASMTLPRVTCLRWLHQPCVLIVERWR